MYICIYDIDVASVQLTISGVGPPGRQFAGIDDDDKIELSKQLQSGHRCAHLQTL